MTEGREATWQEGDPCPKCGGPMNYSRWFENHWCEGTEDEEDGGCGHREPPIPVTPPARKTTPQE